jgi:S1-C subfamily serine protease
MDTLSDKILPGDIVILSGSLPKGAPQDTYRRWSEHFSAIGARVFLDADGACMAEGIQGKPYLVKPNETELSRVLQRPMDTIDALLAGGKELLAAGITNAVISLGGDGALFLWEDSIYRAKSLSVPVLSTVGAGDSVVAAMAYGLQNNLSKEEQIRTVYQNSLESTFCIFTPGGNNGTGFLYNDTYVITNAHVLYDTDQFTLMDAEKNEYTGTVVFTDYETDIAVIQAEEIHGQSVRLGNSDDVRSGDRLILIGNPADGEPFSFCTGERLKPVDFVQQMDQEGLYIPSDADLRSGYSGGPVFNLSGELIGISNAAYTGDLSEYGLEHLSLIIPINRVKQEIENNCAD